MPQRKLPEPVTKVTLNLFTSDYIRLTELYASIGPTVALRQILRNHIEKMDKKLAAASGAPPEIEVEVTE